MTYFIAPVLLVSSIDGSERSDLGLFILLLAAHVLSDFVLQRDIDVQGKRSMRGGPFIIHGLTHLIVAYVLLGIWLRPEIAISAALTHLMIDLIKQMIENRRANDPGGGLRRFGLDQAAHLFSLFLIVRLVGPGESFWVESLGENYLMACALASGFLITVFAGGYVVAIGTRPFLNQLRSTPALRPDDDSSLQIDARGFTGAGQTIGRLERAIIFVLVLNGAWAGVGLIAAAKSVFRFGELTAPRQRKEAEYILIGTLMSFAWAMFATWGTMSLMTRLF